MLDIILNWLRSLGSFALSKVFPAVLLAVLGILAIQLLMKLIGKALEKTKLAKVATRLVLSVLQVALYLLLGLIVASKLGIDVTGIVALASVLTLAISLSVQAALSNVIGGFTLLYTKPFTSGDFVEIAGKSGTVLEVGLTYTKLATPDNKIVSLPNSAVTAGEIINFTVTGTRRVDITVSASYTTPVEQVLASLCEAAQVPGVLADPAVFAGVDKYGESAIVYVVRSWCKSEDYWTVYFDTNQNIRTVFEKNGIAMTYPHLNVHLDK